MFTFLSSNNSILISLSAAIYVDDKISSSSFVKDLASSTLYISLGSFVPLNSPVGPPFATLYFLVFPASVIILSEASALNPLANLSANSGIGPLNSNIFTPTPGLSAASLFILHLCVATVTVSIVKNSGGSFDTSITLYLDVSVTASSELCFFFNNKYVSSCILFLSQEGNDNQILPSSAA